MRLIDADKLKQHYAWWNDEIKELFDTIVDLQPTVEVVNRIGNVLFAVMRFLFIVTQKKNLKIGVAVVIK